MIVKMYQMLSANSEKCSDGKHHQHEAAIPLNQTKHFVCLAGNLVYVRVPRQFLVSEQAKIRKFSGDFKGGTGAKIGERFFVIHINLHFFVLKLI